MATAAKKKKATTKKASSAKSTKSTKSTAKPAKAKAKKATPVESVEVPAPKPRKSSRLNVQGRTVVLTGTVPGLTRKEAEARLEAAGATCTSSVSKNTDFVFAMEDAGSKKADAERLGITVLDKDALFFVIGQPDAPKQAAEKISPDLKEKVAERKADLFEEDGFSGKTVVITGTLSKGRSEIAAMLEEAGAKVSGSVSANTHYLITGAGVGAAKTSKATALGVTVIDEATMNTMLGWS